MGAFGDEHPLHLADRPLGAAIGTPASDADDHNWPVHRVPRDVSVQLFRRRPAPELFLMLHRNPGLGGFWQPVTGAPLPRESELNAAIREVREETGLDVSETIFPLDVRYRYRLDPARSAHWEQVYGPGVSAIDVIAFAAEIEQSAPELNGVEHQGFRWFAYEDAASAMEWPVESDALAGRLAALTALKQ